MKAPPWFKIQLLINYEIYQAKINIKEKEDNKIRQNQYIELYQYTVLCGSWLRTQL